ncbi:hypothetical protein [Hyalangium versicolor]|uniref:hypothetical protein n=1 Tax=Hyalangium versicolor TaxID=2861190 RepID=UPI001CCE588F|nr:hypothetical protein [Hyalangium versicolor]
MDLKTGIFSLALGSLLIGSAARADDMHTATAAQEIQTQAFAYNGQARRSPQPPAPRNQQGRYELKRVQQFVAGRYEKVWVADKCRFVARGGTCNSGHYEQKWVAGHYETVEQWVWVPAQHRGPGSRWG